MADELPADDLRSILSASFDEAAKPAATDTAVAEVKPATESAKPEADAKPADDRPRAADGKFAKKDEAAEKADAKVDDKAKEEPKAEPKTEAKTDADKDTKTEPKSDGKEAPTRWSASDKAMFKLQSPEAQEFLLRRHAAMESEFTKRTTEIADLRKDYEPVQKLFSPYLDVLKQKGLTPHTVIQRWADVETKLANGGGIDIIDGLVKGYGIDRAELARKLGLTASPQGERSTETQAADVTAAGATQPQVNLPPELLAELRDLRNQVNGITQSAQTTRQQAIAQRESEVETRISTFKSQTDEKGQLLHPYFDEVEHKMIALAQSYATSKQPIPELSQLYDEAVYANPSTRQALLATQRAAQEAKANEEARAKAASARRAASSVTGAPGSGQATRPVRSELSLREQLEEAASEHQAA